MMQSAERSGVLVGRQSIRRRIAARAIRGVLSEMLEQRTLMCATDPVMGNAELMAGLQPSVYDHNAAWYKPVATSDATGNGGGNGTSDTDPTWTTNAAGLPLLTQRADGGGMKVFLDFDGYNADTPFSLDADGTTFNAAEQKVIYDTYRDIVSFYAMLDVNVTTVQPPTGGSNPVFVWQRISNSISGGAAYVGWLTNDSSQGWTGSENATGRHSGIAHEIGHQLGLSHQSEYDRYGTKTDEYTDGFSNRDRAVIGVDYAENVRGWFYGRNSDNAANLVDDLQSMANTIKSRIGGDGYRPDDYSNLSTGAANLGAGGLANGIIERINDADYFKITTTAGGAYEIGASPTFESAASPKIELLDSSLNILAARDDADQRNFNDNAQEFTATLAPNSTYYVRVSGSGDESEQGEYLLSAAPLPGATWSTTDVGANAIYRGGAASYDPATGILTQVGGGVDIWTNNDQFRFTYTTLNGDGSITARVDALDNIGQHTKAGVDIRQSLANNSAHAFMGVKASPTLDPIARSTSGGNAVNAGASAASNNRWVRLTRVGDVFTLFSSGDGIAWTTVGTTNIAMSGPVYIGLATCAWNNRAQAYSQFSNISLTGNLGTAAPTYNALETPVITAIAAAAGASTGINLAWPAVTDATGYLVERSVDGITYATAATLGAAALTYADGGLFGSMRYFYRVSALAADSTRSAPSAAKSIVNKPATPTIPNTSYAPAFMTPSTSQIFLNWADVQGDEGYRVERSSNGGTTYTQIATTPVNATGYNDSSLSASTSYTYRITPLTSIGDGVAASLIINAVTQLSAPTNLHFTSITSTTVALAWTDATSETGYRLQRSTDNSTWTTISTLAANATTATDGGLAPVQSYYYRLIAFNTQIDSSPAIVFAATPSSTTFPTGWTNGDIGPVSGQGASGVVGSTWTIIGSGNDIYDATDSFQYARRSVVGDGSIVARVTSAQNTQDYAKNGVMFRATTASNSMSVMLAYTPNGGLEFNVRSTTGGGTATIMRVNSITTGVYLRLLRAGNLFTASYSTDNTNWTSMGSVTVALPSTALAGLAVSSHNTAMLDKATFDNVVVIGNGTGTTNTAPVITTNPAANPNLISGTTTVLTVSATDDGPATALTYTWSAAGKPANAPTPTFSVNGTNGASTSTATFYAPGNYLMRVTVADAGGLTTTSQVIVTVTAVATSISIDPSAATEPMLVAPGATQTFTAVVKDQFGNAMSGTALWSATAGTISSAGVWTAPNTAGTATIKATLGGLAATRDIQTKLVVANDIFDVNASQQQLRFTFNGDVGASLSAGDFVLNQVAADGVTVLQTIAASATNVAYDASSRTATLTFPTMTNGSLPDGNWRVTLGATSTADTSSGILLGDDVTLDFYTLAGDANRDRIVDFNDLLTLAKNFNGGGHTFGEGNFDYSLDGVVAFNDLLMLAKNYGVSMPAPAAPAAGVPAPAATQPQVATASALVDSTASTGFASTSTSAASGTRKRATSLVV